MPDMLVKLYTLPALEPVIAQQRADGVIIRRGLPPEKHNVLPWVAGRFSDFWASETDIAFGNQPPSVFVAVQVRPEQETTLLGFGCYDATCKGFFGPTGVDEAARGRGLGKALLLACLHAMRAVGYGYAIIGAAGPTEFYERIVGATVIPDSWPGIYADLLRDKQ